MSTSPEGNSHAYWRAVISHLATPEQRDAAWEFYNKRIASAESADILSGLILMLEANGTYLSSLPRSIYREHLEPFRRDIAAMEKGFHEVVTTMQEAVSESATATEKAREAAWHMHTFVRNSDLKRAAQNLRDAQTGMEKSYKEWLDSAPDLSVWVAGIACLSVVLDIWIGTLLIKTIPNLPM